MFVLKEKERKGWTTRSRVTEEQKKADCGAAGVAASRGTDGLHRSET